MHGYRAELITRLTARRLRHTDAFRLPLNQRPAFTLTEMLVVLTILAVMALVAVQATEGLVDQTRYDSTKQTIDNVRNAIIGDPTLRHSDGTPHITGFVADTGRLPTSLLELINEPTGGSLILSKPSKQFDTDRDTTLENLSLVSGWRGPYLRLPVGQTTIIDGWGRLINETPPSVAAPNYRIESYGANGIDVPDNTMTEGTFDADIYIDIAPSEYEEKIDFKVWEFNTVPARVPPTLGRSDIVSVLLYGPNVNGAMDGSIEEVVLPVELTNFTADRSNTSIGYFAARAIVWQDSISTNGQPDVGEVSRSSPLYYFTNSIGSPVIDLYLQ